MIDKIQQYLNKRARGEALAADIQLEKYIQLSKNILKVYYYIDSVAEQDYIWILAQESLFIYNNNIDLDTFYTYEGLSTFNIAGSIQGTVSDETGSLLSPFVKAICKSLDIQKKQQDASADYFQTFGNV